MAEQLLGGLDACNRLLGGANWCSAAGQRRSDDGEPGRQADVNADGARNLLDNGFVPSVCGDRDKVRTLTSVALSRRACTFPVAF